ncbi:hypothetical protein BD414DRAFT_109053 [Trametes punicea]|nr:hypothetical protein BD414DRAFT_109053 [Trametes punicea]
MEEGGAGLVGEGVLVPTRSSGHKASPIRTTQSRSDRIPVMSLSQAPPLAARPRQSSLGSGVVASSDSPPTPAGANANPPCVGMYSTGHSPPYVQHIIKLLSLVPSADCPSPLDSLVHRARSGCFHHHPTPRQTRASPRPNRFLSRPDTVHGCALTGPSLLATCSPPTGLPDPTRESGDTTTPGHRLNGRVLTDMDRSAHAGSSTYSGCHPAGMGAVVFWAMLNPAQSPPHPAQSFPTALT